MFLRDLFGGRRLVLRITLYFRTGWRTCCDLFDVSTRSLAQGGHGVDEEDECSDNGHGSCGAHQVQSLGVRGPVVAGLGLGPITKDSSGTGHEQHQSDEVEQSRDLPWDARRDEYLIRIGYN